MTEAELEAAVVAAPDDDAPRAELAGVLTRRGDPHGEFIALQLEIARIRRTADVGARVWGPLWERSEALRKSYSAAWVPQLPAFATKPEFRRGFIEWVTVPAGALDRLSEVFARAPVRCLRVVDIGDRVEMMFARTLSRIVALDLFGQRIGDPGAVALGRSDHLQALVWLDLYANGIGAAGLDALLASDKLPRLAYINFAANDVDDPVEGFGVDNGIVSTSPSDATLVAEQRFGYRAWLHTPSLHPEAYPPEPEDLDQR